MHTVPPEAKSSTFFNVGKYKMPSLINLSSVIYVDLDYFGISTMLLVAASIVTGRILRIAHF
jgi:hypothetical protein